MKRALIVLRYLAINAASGIALYYATFENVAGAQNIITVLTWLLFILSLTLVSRKSRVEYQARIAEQGGPSVPRWLDVSIDLAFVLVLIWFGFILLGVLWMVHAINLGLAKKPVEPEEGGDT